MESKTPTTVMYIPVNASLIQKFLEETRREEHFGKLPLWPTDNPFTVGDEKATPGLFAWTSAYHAIHVARLHGWRLSQLTLIKVELPAATVEALTANSGLVLVKEDVVWRVSPFLLFALNSPEAEISIAEKELVAVRHEFAQFGITE